MKKMFVSVILVFAIVVALLPATAGVVKAASSATGTYVTTKSCPVWNSLSLPSTIIRTLPKGTYITIVSVKKNSSGEYWGQTKNNTWIYIRDIEISSKSAGVAGYYVASKSKVPLRYTPASGQSIKGYMKQGEQIKISSAFFNDVGNAWASGTYKGKTYVVYLGNLVPLSSKVDNVVSANNGTSVKSTLLQKNYSATECKGVMEYLVDKIYGIGNSGSLGKNGYTISDTRFALVNQLLTKNDKITTASLKSFFAEASKGDVIQYRHNEKQHSAIFLSTTKTGVMVIDGNWSGTHTVSGVTVYLVQIHEISFSYLTQNLTKSYTGISIYHVFSKKNA